MKNLEHLVLNTYPQTNITQETEDVTDFENHITHKNIVLDRILENNQEEEIRETSSHTSLAIDNVTEFPKNSILCNLPSKVLMRDLDTIFESPLTWLVRSFGGRQE